MPPPASDYIDLNFSDDEDDYPVVIPTVKKTQSPRLIVQKPTILCLHGGGTNAQIFQLQTLALRTLLSPLFEFEFLSGPFTTTPGPDVLPYFAGCGPYMNWVRPDSTLEGAKGSDDVTGLDISSKKLWDFIDGRRKKDGKGFVGVMGFSMGARASAGLLREEQEARTRGELGEREGLQFGVLLNSAWPALDLRREDKREGPVEVPHILTPSLHVVGKLDPWCAHSRKMRDEAFDEQTRRSFEFDVGHRLPILKTDTALVAQEIEALWRRTSPEDTENNGGIKAQVTPREEDKKSLRPEAIGLRPNTAIH